MLRLRLLGEGRLFDGLAEIGLPSRMWTLPILAYLVLHRGEAVSRKRLAFLIWPDAEEEIAFTNLRRNLHRLTKALPKQEGDEPWMTVATATVTWNESTACEIDTGEFERLSSDPKRLEEAVTFYAGDYLSDNYDDWVAAERERLRRLYHSDLQSLIVACRSRRAFAEAEGYARRLLVSDPWHEDALRALMSVRYEAGDAAGALAEFDLFARAIRTEMNVSPMPETIALRDAISRGAIIPSAASAPEASATRSQSASPFVGRTEELAHLQTEWLRAARGSGRMIFVRGEGGIGKSRLVSELALITESEGGRVLSGTTSSPERNPNQCLASALRGALPLVGAVPLAPPFLAAVAGLVPELRSYRDDIPHFTPLDPANERARLLDALAQMFAGLAKPRPLLLILEDLHRAGAATIEAIAGIVPRLSRSPVLVVATCRPEHVDRTHPLRAMLHTSDPPPNVLELGPLNEHNVKLLVDASEYAERSTPEFLASLLQKSAGNPLFVTELLNDAYHTGGFIGAIPASVNAMIVERVASLAPASRTVADVAAVVGDAFTVELVRDVARLPNAELADGIDELLDRHLIRESTERGRYEYAFTHHLVRAAIYEAIALEARVRRHRRIARILDTALEINDANVAGERDAEIALHHELGGNAQRAAVLYGRAARRAAGLFANAEARDFVGRSLALDPGNDRERFERLLLRRQMHERLTDADAETADVSELQLVAARLDENAMCEALVARVELAYRQADHAAELAALATLTQRATALESERWLAAVAEIRARRYADDRQKDLALESALEARDRYRGLGNDIACARAAAFGAEICGDMPGRAAESERLSAEALHIAQQSGEPELLIRIYMLFGVLSQQRADHVRMAEWYRAALAVSLDVGDRGAEARCRANIGVAANIAGRDEEAMRELREALDLFATLGIKRIANTMINYGVVLGRVGDFRGAIEWYRRARERARSTHATDMVLMASLNIADEAWQCGDIETMATALEDANATSEGVKVEAFAASLRGHLLRCRRDFDASLEELKRALALAESMDWSRQHIPEAIDELALTHLARHDVAAARAAIDRSSEIWRTNGEISEYPIRHHWIDACIHREAGDLDEARRELERAHTIYLERYAALSAPDLRASFAAIPMHRGLRAAFERDQWPAPDSPCVIAFPEGSMFAAGR